jgi:hypothetical protein
MTMGMLTDTQRASEGVLGRAATINVVRQAIPKAVRAVVERFEHACLDSKADREALITALVEALS